MPDHDGSMASLVEFYLVATIAAGVADLDTDHVEIFPGLQKLDSSIGDVVNQFRAERSPFVAVMWAGRTPIQMTERTVDYRSTYKVWVCVQNERDPHAARIGEDPGAAPVAGTNLLVEQIMVLLHLKKDAGDSTALYTDLLEIGAAAPIALPQGVSIVELDVTAYETVKT